MSSLTDAAQKLCLPCGHSLMLPNRVIRSRCFPGLLFFRSRCLRFVVIELFFFFFFKLQFNLQAIFEVAKIKYWMATFWISLHSFDRNISPHTLIVLANAMPSNRDEHSAAPSNINRFTKPNLIIYLLLVSVRSTITKNQIEEDEYKKKKTTKIYSFERAFCSNTHCA